VAVGQSLFCKHATQVLIIVLQSGVAPLHCELLVQPCLHVKPCGLQMGCAVPQSEFARHCTHVWSPRKHRGAEAPQSPFERQSTH
jgi:hypothetical protein